MKKERKLVLDSNILYDIEGNMDDAIKYLEKIRDSYKDKYIKLELYVSEDVLEVRGIRLETDADPEKSSAREVLWVTIKLLVKYSPSSL